ncbi:hypothetical protein HPB52_007896 [Rhipicephalus sanguineus]|uniref:Uncharacterized protein n=1 Tax=Rhipicephalus sanguineus TaxID=34632 RepID=A0A9D4PW80_RHISA|nr:hypothetical protein HPB52_007896 [Rhipicephalus sanguineus]
MPPRRAAIEPRYQSTREDTGNRVIPPLRYLVRLTGRSEPESPEPRASIADPNASSARPPLRLGMATRPLGAFETTTSSHGEPTPADNMDLTGPGSSTMDDRHDGIADTSRQNTEGRPRTDDDWHTVLTLSQISSLTINGRAHAVNVCAATGDDAIRGVIHGLPPPTPAETINANLPIRTQGVELVHARMIGDTKSAALTFSGPSLPRVVYYNGGKLLCHPYRATAQTCTCAALVDSDPPDGHPCEPKCASCGGAHITGDRSCQRRLKRPRPPQGRQGTDKPKDGKGNTAIPSASKRLVQVIGNPPKQIPLLPTRGHPTRKDIATTTRGTIEGEGRHFGNAIAL